MANRPERALAGVPDDGRPTAETADALLDRLAEAVRIRVAGRRAAESRLAAFAFVETKVADPGSLSAGSDDPGDLGHFVRSALGALGDPDAVRILEALRSDDQPLAVLMEVIEPAVRDRLVAIDRISSLASAGLVGRDLESDRVALTPLGEALLDLVADLKRRAAVMR